MKLPTDVTLDKYLPVVELRVKSFFKVEINRIIDEVLEKESKNDDAIAVHLDRQTALMFLEDSIHNAN